MPNNSKLSLFNAFAFCSLLVSNSLIISILSLYFLSAFLRNSFQALLFFIFNRVSRYDLKCKHYLSSGEKYYATDVTMRYALLGRKYFDLGHILENIVYLELLRRGYKVYTGKVEDLEIDFVAENKNGLAYYQVSLTTRDEKTLERELKPLKKTGDFYPKYLLTMDRDLETDYDGIRKINVLDWLLGEEK